MSFERQLDKAHTLLLERGFMASSINPVIYRLARKLGLKVPPPQFASISVNILLSTIWFGTIWGVIMWFMQWNSLGISLQYAFNASVTTGFIFGLLMAAWYKFTAKRKKLPRWGEI